MRINIKGMIQIAKKTYIIIGCLLVVGVVAWDVLRSGNNVSDNGVTADTITNDIRSVGYQQQSAITGVGNAQDRINDGSAEVGRVSEGIGTVAESIKHSQSGLEESITRSKSSADLIAEGKSILRTIQQGNDSGN